MNITIFKNILLITSIFIGLAPDNLKSQNNYIDQSYCDDGTCIIESPFQFSEVMNMSFDSQDNLYVSLKPSSSSVNHFLTKVNKDGILDASFGQNGAFLEEDPGYVIYQKDDYIFSLRVAGGGTAVNIYDLELNFIQRYVLIDEASINNIYYSGEYFIGSTLKGFVFKYNTDGSLDTDFAQDGIFNLENETNALGLNINGYAYTSEGDIHYCYKSGYPDSQLIKLDNNGLPINTDLITPGSTNVTSLLGLTNLISTVQSSFNGHTIFGHLHLTEDLQDRQGEFQKVNQFGIVSEFGNQGSILTPVLPDGEAQLIGELASENLIISYGTNSGVGTVTLPNVTYDILIITPQGFNNQDFGDNGFLEIDLIPGQKKYLAKKSNINDHLYITSSSGSALLSITKLDLKDVAGTPITSAVHNTNNKASLNLFPNPSDTYTKLLYVGPAIGFSSLEIINSTGLTEKIIHIDNLSSNDEIKIITKDLIGGLYTLRLSTSGNHIATHRLIVTH